MDDHSAGETLVLWPDPTSRIVGATAFMMLPVSAIWMYYSGPERLLGFELFALVYVTVCSGLAWRLLRLRIELEANSFLAVGFFSSKEVPRAGIQSIGGLPSYPSVIWVDQAGRKRATAVLALATRSTAFPYFRRRAATNREALIAWIDGS
jgi:hypothetical protein